MIHHISVAAYNPLHVSQVLAELLQGQSIPFPGHSGSYVALAFDPQGTMVEVHPFGTALVPGEAADEASQLLPNPAASMYSANHTAISVPVSTDRIQAIAEREGWRTAYCRRGEDYFDVIEFWVENRLLIELLPPEIVDRYLAFMSPESLVAAARAAAAKPPTAA
ncbi:hypothetical protein [Chamaesiphon polymorphus]|uniref:VOC domain-containing protein n=1 Tax=Chamaesiphon polymorphus CCALA 037 TaxID=2107692 RepID=A0A2T1G5Q4_9CYAN|nr:hypothetical protein [Chamaesiphon polymorphus]PSB52510.1 hypothetical protein C7B77_20435 [Chamaesiphon polymorphus CCALA 037]